MQTLRHAQQLARLVLVWFMCALGVAVASPMVHPQALELVCSSGGAVKLLVKTDNGVQDMGAHSLDCPLCLLGSAPPLPAQARLPALPVSTPLPAAPPGVHAVAPMATPPPARAPPFSLCQS